MGGDRRKEIIRHLSEGDLDRFLSEADDPKVVRRLTFVKNLYAGDTLEDAAARVGKSESQEVGGHGAGTKEASDSSRRTSGTDAPRSSAKMNRNSWLRCSVRVSPGNHRKFSISSTRNLASNTTQSI